MPLAHLKHHQIRMALAVGFNTGNWSAHDKLIISELDEATRAVTEAKEAESLGEAEVGGGLSGSGVNPPNEQGH